jgi:hypothetical protein
LVSRSASLSEALLSLRLNMLTPMVMPTASMYSILCHQHVQ